ncbi:MAG TPA: hypothetical protein VNJ04_02195 [Gemmatimonadaceae bacterium]|nr:hypothetical protein [Gemmatimonadaceae bacterium]
MAGNPDGPIAILYEHPDWFRPLFAELDRRAIPYVTLDVTAHWFDPDSVDIPYSLLFNRASPSAFLRGNAQSIFYTLDLVRYFERAGVAVVNGSAVYQNELSKALQLGVLRELGLPFPRSRVINSPLVAAKAADGLRYPIVVKANIGGSGAGITRYATAEDLARGIAEGSVQLGIDDTALVQEFVPYRGGHITRVETLNSEYLYGINVYPADDSFNLCPADVCQTTAGEELARAACALDAPKNGMRVEAYTPPRDIIEQVELIARTVRLDVGGIEYFVDDRDGQHYFYDINALSNFVADAPRVIGFDPFEKLVDYLVARRGAGTEAVVAEEAGV